jgi:outer membrane protein assembly factor BamB
MPFVLKVDGGSGNTIWMQQFSSDSVLSAMYPSALLASGTNLYLQGSVGSYGTSATIELVELNLDTGGTNWKFQFGAGADNLPGQSIAVDSVGNIYCGGMTKGALASGVDSGTQDVFLAKLSTSGTPIWAQQIGTGSDGPQLANTGSTPIFLSAGATNVVLAGMTSGQFPGSTNSNHAIELFVAGFGQ